MSEQVEISSNVRVNVRVDALMFEQLVNILESHVEGFEIPDRCVEIGFRVEES